MTKAPSWPTRTRSCFYFATDIARWLGEGRLSHLQTAFSRVPEGGGCVQDAVRHAAQPLRSAVTQGAIVRMAGFGEDMALAQRIGLDARLLLRRADEGLVEMGRGQLGGSRAPSNHASASTG